MNKVFDLSKKIVVLTGGTGLLGSEYTNSLLAAGASVIIADLEKSNPEIRAANLSKQYKNKIFGINCDVSNEDEVISLFKYVKDNFGRVDVVINNAAATGEHLMREGAVFTSLKLRLISMGRKLLRLILLEYI